MAQNGSIPSIMRIKPRCTHRRVPGSRLVGTGDADV